MNDNQLILDFLKLTNQPVFLTGKAGTGKTTLLKHIKDTTEKNFAIVAPTAVAAINAGGVTLHSFFQIPFGPLIPVKQGEVSVQEVRYSEDKIKLLRCLDLLIIDEISMVRADLIDFIDHALRTVKASSRPFGGVQVLMIGDLYQLSPIAHDAWHILKTYYPSPYFFDSQVLRSISMTTFQLDKVYRQSDPVFLDILNGIRENTLSSALLDRLNERYDPGLDEVWKDEYVTLTTHNHLVTQINQECLEKLAGEIYLHQAVISGDFPKDAYPVDEILQLKVGAQVMFIKNDSSGKKQFYNGKAAKILAINSDSVKVQFIDDGSALEVIPEEWQNLKYNLNQEENKINEVNTGTFSQYPFKLAWAITVHKSQGLTFEQAIVDVSSSFTHGQAYVALSRCRSLEGLVLKSPVKMENIITDSGVIKFTKQSTETKPDHKQLDFYRMAFEWSLIDDLLDFQMIQNHWQQLKLSNFNHTVENSAFRKLMDQCSKILETEIIKIANQFKNQERSKIPETNDLKTENLFMERLKKASAYFIPKIEGILKEIIEFHKLKIYRDEHSEKILNLLNYCFNALNIKLELFKISWDNFNPVTYMQAYHAGSIKEIDQKTEAVKKIDAPKKIINPLLYHDLLSWRKGVSEKRNVAEHTILSEQVLQLIAEKLPKSTEQLAAIKGVGIGNATDHGREIIKSINNYLGTNELF
ncbi:HRDC domain-containing protein [Pedobacter punctiformis]|uniref:AAA family ATPase n=1 Tax=Pedobacter punctiformis TaxID=3004097 RepID=A0ABT4L6J0_9SPHI|nr:HRDC domain-containing protein [Pedobacter sp. HCMS5-2]MCZ4243547.1 AAA family ATPase [Pedobacter sp. HCMS5-2]